jgi:predicted Zn-dependent protease
VTRNPVWRDNDVFFPQLVRDAPGSFRAYWTEAMLQAKKGNQWRAELLMRRAIAIQPLSPGLWRDLARYMNLTGRYSEAAEYFWTAWRLDNSEVFDAQRAIQNGVLAGALDSAEVHLAQVQAVWPDAPPIKLAAAELALARNQPLRAMTLRRQAALAFRDSTRYWALTADAAARARHCPELHRSVDRVRALQPTWPELPRLDSAMTALGCQQPPA